MRQIVLLDNTTGIFENISRPFPANHKLILVIFVFRVIFVADVWKTTFNYRYFDLFEFGLFLKHGYQDKYGRKEPDWEIKKIIKYKRKRLPVRTDSKNMFRIWERKSSES